MNQNLISDCLTRIRNGVMASLITVVVVKNKTVIGILECFLKEGYIQSYESFGKYSVLVTLKYSTGIPAIELIKVISKPSKRVYSSISELRSFRNGLGTIILSTSFGIITDHEARLNNVGGELLCKVF